MEESKVKIRARIKERIISILIEKYGTKVKLKRINLSFIK